MPNGIQETKRCHMSVHYGDTVMSHNDNRGTTLTFLTNRDLIFPETICIRGSRESLQPFISQCRFLSSVSVCSEDESAMPVHGLLVCGSGGGEEGGRLRESLTHDDLTGLI